MEALTMADPQTLLWQHLKIPPKGLQFVRDLEGGGFNPPLYCAEAHLAIEADDDPCKPKNDGERERWQEQHRVDIMQVPPSHVRRNASEVAAAIVDIASRRKERFAKSI
jgi:very-short-patch-repair endonuclease